MVQLFYEIRKQNFIKKMGHILTQQLTSLACF